MKPVIRVCLSGSTSPDASFSREDRCLHGYQLQENIQRSLAAFQTVKCCGTSCCLRGLSRKSGILASTLSTTAVMGQDGGRGGIERAAVGSRTSCIFWESKSLSEFTRRSSAVLVEGLISLPGCSQRSCFLVMCTQVMSLFFVRLLGFIEDGFKDVG